jgi:hypothetical protein
MSTIELWCEITDLEKDLKTLNDGYTAYFYIRPSDSRIAIRLSLSEYMVVYSLSPLVCMKKIK